MGADFFRAFFSFFLSDVDGLGDGGDFLVGKFKKLMKR
jgi:hypothetical protein